MAFDYKKEYKEFYLPPREPAIVDVPAINFIAVRGKGDPNAPDGDYKKAIGTLYGVAFTLKMSSRAGHKIDGWFEYVVPPLEGLWWQEGTVGVDYSRKADFNWISLIRLPDFVTRADFEWAVAAAAAKKKADFSSAEFFTYAEGLCVQCLHVGPYDDEPATVARMHEFAAAADFDLDITPSRLHHEIYLSDARKCAPDKLRTVVRHPVKKRP